WTRHGHLDRPLRLGAQELHVANFYGSAAADGAHDAWHGVELSRAAQRFARVVEIGPVERRGEVIAVALAPDFAVSQDVDARALELVHDDSRRVVLRLLEIARVDAPHVARPHPRRQAREQLVAVDQPIRLRIAPDERCRQRRYLHTYAGF